jgi:hypothetical protein
MKNIYLGCIVLVLVISSNVKSVAQNIASTTIAWNAERVFNATTGQWMEQATSIVTYGNSRIEWKNSNGSIRSRFQVIELIGEWSNIGSEGHVQYEITDGANSGTITVRKEGGEIKVLISIGSSTPTLEELTIVSTQIL